MSANNFKKASHTIQLIFFQILGLAIPLLTLPIVARALGVEIFGELMLAQSIVFLGVLFLDAGFNTESQRLIALAKNEIEVGQVLLNNVVARSIFAIPVILVLLITPFFFQSLSLEFIFYSLPLIFGTLLFPQWWLIALNKGHLLGLALTTGRVLSAVTIVAAVHEIMDAKWAALAMSSATLISGIILSPVVSQSILNNWKQLRLSEWGSYYKTIRVTLFSGFFSSASASLPVLILSQFTGAYSVGIYSAADRLTRAAGYVLSFVEQSMMIYFVKTHQMNKNNTYKTFKTMMTLLVASLLLMAVFNYWLAPWVIAFLYGSAFQASVVVLKILGIWLALFGLRKGLLTFFWSATGQLQKVSKFQWLEAIFVPLFSLIGVVIGKETGLAIALCCLEFSLIALMYYNLKNHPPIFTRNNNR